MAIPSVIAAMSILTGTALSTPSPASTPVPSEPNSPRATEAATVPSPPQSNEYVTWEKPRSYDTTFNVGIHCLAVIDPNRPLLMPLVLQGASSFVNLDTLQAEVQLHGKRLDGGRGPELINGRGIFNEGMIEAPTKDVRIDKNTLNLATQLRFSVFHQAICYSSEVDEEALQSIPWPESWPSSVRDALKPQALIESDDPVFANVVQEVSEGNLRQVPPWIAAKELVRHACNTIQKNGETTLYGPGQSIRGLDVNGAIAAAQRESGTPNDLVCVCVALLRAAGIPARPVIGRGEDRKGKKRLLVWAELFLPGAGWVPFDPDEIRRKGARHWKVENDWNGFGTVSDLNRRVPLAYAFAPDNGRAAYDCYAIWGWSRLESMDFPVPVSQWQGWVGDLRLQVEAWNTPSVLHFEMVSHGRVDIGR